MLSDKAQIAVGKVIGLMQAAQHFRTRLRLVRIKQESLLDGQRRAEGYGTMFSRSDYQGALAQDILDLQALADKVREIADTISDHDRAYVLPDLGSTIGFVIRREEAIIGSAML